MAGNCTKLLVTEVNHLNIRQRTPLDAELGAYKGRYGVNDQYVRDVLGRGGSPMGKDAYIRKRKGVVEFTARELKCLADLLGMPIDEAYELLPPINHRAE